MRRCCDVRRSARRRSRTAAATLRNRNVAGSGPTTAATAPGVGACAGACVATHGIGVDVACDTGGWSVCVASDGDVSVVVIFLPPLMAAHVGLRLAVPGRAAHTPSRTTAPAHASLNIRFSGVRGPTCPIRHGRVRRCEGRRVMTGGDNRHGEYRRVATDERGVSPNDRRGSRRRRSVSAGKSVGGLLDAGGQPLNHGTQVSQAMTPACTAHVLRAGR